jgi:hypothetical protein
MHEAGHGLLDAAESYRRGDMTRVFVDGTSIVKMLATSKESRQQARQTRTSPADVIQLSGCKNYETSADTVEAVCLVNVVTDYRVERQGL